MKSFLSILMLMITACLLSMQALAIDFTGEPPAWVYDAGPDINSEDPFEKKMAQELVELNARIPYFPGISTEIMGSQKYRPAFGPIPWRMLQKPNSVKILFIGQDGTHIAEAAGRPATAGFGGRAHDLANYFGVDYSAAFINTYAFTINGQYGDRGVPFLYNNKGKTEVRYSGGAYNGTYYGSYIDNELWLMTQGQDSPITKWRNELIDWIIRNNKDSLKMIVTFGGSAKDSISSYIVSRGGDVGTRLHESELKKMQFPEFKLQYAGGNSQFPVPVDKYGNDLYEELFGKRPNYVPPFQGFGDDDNQAEVQKLLENNVDFAIENMVFARGGRDNSGALNPAQLGGYDVSKLYINGKRTISLKGLTTSDNQAIGDVLVVDLPHPTFLSNKKPHEASGLVGQKVRVVEPYVKNGWSIEPDAGQEPRFFNGERYEYRRGDIGQEYYDFGTPGNRMVAKSDAKRLDKNVILLGARQDPYFDRFIKRSKQKGSLNEVTRLINAMIDARPAERISNDEMFISVSRTPEEVSNFDPGPGETFAKLMKNNLNLKEILREKSGMEWGYYDEKKRKFYGDGNASTNVKSHPSVEDFGHYRGTFKQPKVVILADPHGWDDIITARALTGTRGQFLQGLMNDAKVGTEHLVFKTVPFGMEGATQQEWNIVLQQTEDYREAVLKAVLMQNGTKLLLTDGPQAQSAMEKFLKKNPEFKSIDLVNIKRTSDNRADMLRAGRDISDKSSYYSNISASGKMVNIPGSHLSYYARVWEGTSGDSVITAKGVTAGLAFAEVVPDWVVEQNVKLSPSTQDGVDKLKAQLCNSGLPLPGEKPLDFVSRSSQENFPKCSSF